MSKLGIGVMIKNLGGNEDSVKAMVGALGKIISDMSISSDQLTMKFDDGTGIAFRDEGQSCCEHRHMSCDDDLPYYVGAQLLDADLKDGPTIDGEYGDAHEQQFLEIKTSKGHFTVVNHNEHNGYYGGFCVRVSELR